MSAKPKIAVIGAGVCGATVAFRLQEQFGDSVSISIFSEEFSPNTTGDVAGEEILSIHNFFFEFSNFHPFQRACGDPTIAVSEAGTIHL